MAPENVLSVEVLAENVQNELSEAPEDAPEEALEESEHQTVVITEKDPINEQKTRK